MSRLLRDKNELKEDPKAEIKIFRPQPGFQEAMLSTKADIAIGGGAAGSGKLQPLYSKVLTDNGWVRMGDLEVGNNIMCPVTGLPKPILAIYPNDAAKIYTVTFSDGTEVNCCDEHLWRVKSRKQVMNGNHSILTLNEIINRGVKCSNGDNRFSIECNTEINFAKKEVLLHPYLLGLLIGDGYLPDDKSKSIALSVDAREINEFNLRVKKILPIDVKSRLYHVKGTNSARIIFSNSLRKYIEPYGLIGKKSGFKYIPKEYLFNDIESRKQLLAGLVDTDGYINLAKNKKKASFTTISSQLKEDFIELIRGLGGIASSSTDNRIDKYSTDECFKISFRTPFNPFLRKRRKILFDSAEYRYRFVKKITDIKFKGIEPGRCIYVDSESHLYITDGYNTTHNTFTLLMDALYDIDNPKFGYTYFRRNLTQITKQGGLWDASLELYSGVKPSPTPKPSEYKWEFPSGATVSFNHLQYEKDVYSWQGTELAAIGFDELTHFSETTFFYLLSRNRSTSGVRPRVRATCNPEPDSWVAKFIDWWIDEDGFPIKERGGVLRYFLRNGDDLDDAIWGDSVEEVMEKGAHILDRISKAKNVNKKDLIKSVTFIPGSIYENKALLSVDPGYLGNLASQSEAERAKLLDGNWKVKTGGKELVSRETMLKMVDRYPQTNGRRAVTADVAMKGEDNMVIIAWDGFHIIDVVVVKRSNGRQVIEAINAMMQKWHISSENVVYDGNNMGGYIDGFIIGAKEFLNNAPPKNNEYYINLKSQCADKWANRMNGIFPNNKEQISYSIDIRVADRIIDGKSVIDHLLDERRAIRFAESSYDGKTALIKKSEMKNIIGHSPDFIEAMFMIEFLYLSGKRFSGTIIW